MPSAIHLHTVADLLARDHTLGLYCPRCDRWVEAPLAKLAARGLADRPIQRLNFRCVHCGAPARRQLRPPGLPAANGNGWPEARSTVSTAAFQANSIPVCQLPHRHPRGQPGAEVGDRG